MSLGAGGRVFLTHSSQRSLRREGCDEGYLAANMENISRDSILMLSKLLVTIRIGMEVVEKNGAWKFKGRETQELEWQVARLGG